MSTFPDGLYQWGGVPVGSGVGRLGDIFSAGNVWFVDGDNGSTAYTGKKPDDAFTTVTLAVAAATRNGAIIYVRPRTTAASSQTYYQEDIVIPLTMPNTRVVGAGYFGCTNSFSGAQFKPLTVTGHLIEVKAAGFYIENLRLTLSGGTADQGKSIIHAVDTGGVLTKPSGLTIRGCRFSGDKSHPGYTSSDATAAIGLGSPSQVWIEYNDFYECLGGISYTNTSGTANNVMIRGNTFGGVGTSRDVDILLAISASTAIHIVGNVFSDAKPAHSGGGYQKFINIIGGTTGVLANNYFSTTTENAIIRAAAGSDCLIPATFTCPGNFYEGASNTAPYGLATIV